MAGGARPGRGSARSWLGLRPGRRLAAFAVAVTVVLVAAGVALAWNGYVAKKHAAEREVEFVSRAAVVTANSFIVRAEQTLTTLAATTPVRSARPADMLALFKRASLGSTFPGGLSWLDTRGRLVVTTDLPLKDTPPTDFSDREHVRAVVRTRRPYVGRVVIGRRVPYPLFVVAVPTFTADGRFGGVLTGTVRLFASTAVSRALTLGRRDVRVGDRFGTLVAGPEPNLALTPLLDAKAVADLGGRLRPGLHVGIEVDGRTSVVSLARTARAGWWIASIERESSVYAAARRTLLLELLGLISLASVVVIASLLFSARMGRLYTAFRDSAEAERAARGRAELLQAVAARLAVARDGGEVARAIVDETSRALGAASATVFLGGDDGRIGIRATTGYDTDTAARLAGALAAEAPIPAVEACRTGRMVTVSAAGELQKRYPALWELGIRWDALAAVPLAADGSIVGALGWTFDAPRPFDGEFEQLARAIAQHAGLALERARLFEAERVARQLAERERVRLEALQQLSASLAVATTVDAVATAIASHARDPLDASTCAVVVLEPDGRTLRIRRDVGYPEGTIEHLRAGIPLDADIPVAQATRDGEPILFHDLDEIATRFPGMLPVFARVGRAGAVLPLQGTTGTLGGIVLAFAREQAFDRERRDELETFTRLCAQALERASLFEAERALRMRDARMRSRAELLAAISAGVETTMGLAGRAESLVGILVPRVADVAVVELADGECLAIAHVDPDRVDAARQERRRAALDPGHPLSGVGVAREARALLASRLPATHEGEPLEAHSAIAVPIRARGQTVAVLVLELVDPRRPAFDAGDLELAEEIASRMGLAFDNARLYEQEHEIALRLQRALLPVRLLEHDAIAVAGRYEAGHAAMEVGGDWFDTIALPGGRVGIAVGDVVGRGVAAAAAMGRLRTAMAALAPTSDGPGSLLHALERFAENVEGAEFATACYAVLDPSTGRLDYASAGHVPMLLLDADGSTRLLEDGRSAPLCGLGPEPRPEASVQLVPGTTLVVFTDGLVERRREHLSDGLDRLAAAASELAGAPVEHLCDGILARLTAGQRLHDDVALLCLRLERTAPRALELRFPAHPRELANVRAAMREWCVDAGIPDGDRHDLLLAVCEACANAVEHAYVGRPAGEVALELHRTGSIVHATVHDFGRWRPIGPAGDRGRGTPIIEAIATRVERTTGANGTTVRMRFEVGSAGEDAPTEPTPSGLDVAHRG